MKLNDQISAQLRQIIYSFDRRLWDQLDIQLSDRFDKLLHNQLHDQLSDQMIDRFVDRWNRFDVLLYSMGNSSVNRALGHIFDREVEDP
jgi:hypothetical protein